MKTGAWAIISLCSIILVFFIQLYVVYDNYQMNRSFLNNDINDVLSEAFKQDVNRRRIKRQVDRGELNVPPPPPTLENSTVLNVDDIRPGATKEGTISNKDFLSSLSTSINIIISKNEPVDVQIFDSVVSEILKAKDIRTDFSTQMIDLEKDSILQTSDSTGSKLTFLSIQSKYLPLDFQQTKALQLTFLNPLSEILGRMVLVLVSSLVLSLIGFWGLYLIYTSLKKQKRIVEFKNTFFSHVAHELRRPVSTLSFALDQIKRPEIKNNEQKLNRYIGITENITIDMDARITMILTLAKAEEGMLRINRVRYNVAEQITGILQFFRETNAPENVDIHTQLKEDNIEIQADKELLKLVLMNLIENSIKYSDIKPAKIQLTIEKTEKHLSIIVADKGRGIPPEKLDSIFEKYERLNPEDESRKGFGIGLNFVKTIIDAHKGNIIVNSTPGAGTEFEIKLPSV